MPLIKRAALYFVIIFVLSLLAKALYGDWLTVKIGRIRIQETVYGSDMMSYLSSAGSAHLVAEEKISRIVEEHCSENPAECAALGITIQSIQ